MEEDSNMHLVQKYIRALLIEAGASEFQVTPAIQSGSVLYCDMDGVLVNFELGAVTLLNRMLDSKNTLGVKTSKTLRKLRAALGEDWRAQNRADLDIKPVRNFMFSAISENPGDYFSALPPLADGVNQLWPYLNSTGYTVKLLTAVVPGRT